MRSERLFRGRRVRPTRRERYAGMSKDQLIELLFGAEGRCTAACEALEKEESRALEVAQRSIRGEVSSWRSKALRAQRFIDSLTDGEGPNFIAEGP